jgi:PAS domain S-box-containing protein
MAHNRPLGPEAYLAIFEHSLDGVLFTIPDGQVLAANPAACQLLGRSEEEICVLGRQGLADSTDPRWIVGLDERARAGRARGQARMLRADGTTFEVDLSSAIFTTPEGQRRSVVIFRDLSERLALAQQLALADDRDRIAHNLHRTVMRRASAASMLAHGLLGIVQSGAPTSRLGELVQELDEITVEVRQAIFHLESASERRYQTLVENSPVSVAIYRCHDGRFVYANQSAISLYGAHDLDDLLSRHAYEVIPRGLRTGWQKRAQQIVDGAVIRRGRFRLLRLDGKEIVVEINAATVAFDGEPCVQVELRRVSDLIDAEPHEPSE